MYNYQEERSKLFTEEGQRRFLKFRDEALRLLGVAGAFKALHPLSAPSVSVNDTFEAMAILDRMVELGEIRELTDENVAGQHRVFV